MKKVFYLISFCYLCGNFLSAKEYHVSPQGNDAPYGLCVYDPAEWPIQAEDNIFCNGAKPMTGKVQGVVADNYNPGIKLEETSDGVYLSFMIDESYFSSLRTKPVDATRLGKTKLSGLPFEHRDGTPLVLDKDYFGKTRSVQSPMVGPIESLSQGSRRIKLW